MRALAISEYCMPSQYDLATLPIPKVTQPDDILIKVEAASFNPIDIKMASGG
jgi:NADPH:quinone reductase-like Zn-dependent oxidoreductase